MKIIRDPKRMQAQAAAWRAEGKRIGLVPTMGYLHAGHLSLVRLAAARADVVVVSIFVNPTQFGPREDLNRYPRDFVRDRSNCRGAGVDAIFYPAAAAMYPPDYSVYVNEERLSAGLCGARRPGHFRGVCTVVAKLFNLVSPHVAVFGEKDAQQLRVLRRMTRDLNFPIEIVAGPIAREPDGLALSSRNTYLTPAQRRAAPELRRALEETAARYSAGERSAARLRAALRRRLARIPGARVDYVELVDDATLRPVRRVEKPALVALAVWFGKTRLIDNLRLGG